MTQTLINTLTSFAFLAPYFFLFIYLPAFIFTKSLKLTTIERLSANLVLGFSFYSLLVYTVRFLGLPYLATEIIITIFLLANFKSLKVIKIPRLPKLNNTAIIFIPIVIVTALVQSAVLLRSGVSTDSGIQFVNLSFHDSMQHIAIIRQLYGGFDVPNFGFSGVTLKNYHYLIDLTLASLTRFSFISLYDTYYRLYPLTISLIFSLSIFTLARSIIKNKTLSALTILFVVFSGNASYFVHFFRGSEFSWGANTFLINPIVDILQNPASIFVLAQTLTVLFLLKLYPELKSKSQYLILATIVFISGTMIGFKAWGGILILASLFLASLLHLLKSRDIKPFVSWIFVLLLSLFLLLPHYDSATSAGPVWQPGWSLERMINDPDRWNDLNEIFKREHYLSVGSWHYLTLTYAKWFAIYLFGNYWLRIIGFAFILLTIKNIRKFSLYDSVLVLITGASFILPVFLNQGRMAYDIEQFSPYAIVLSSIYAIYLLNRLLAKSKLLTTHNSLLTFLIILISIPSNYTSIKARTTGETTTITKAELATYRKISEDTSMDSIFLLYPSQRVHATLEFPSFTGRNTYYSGRTLSVITGNDWESRREAALKFFRSQDPFYQTNLINENNIDYIFIYAQDLKEAKKPKLKNLEVVFENSTGVLYKVLDSLVE